MADLNQPMNAAALAEAARRDRERAEPLKIPLETIEELERLRRESAVAKLHTDRIAADDLLRHALLNNADALIAAARELHAIRQASGLTAERLAEIRRIRMCVSFIDAPIGVIETQKAIDDLLALIDRQAAELDGLRAERDRLRKTLLEWNEDSGLLPANPEEYTERDIVAVDGIITNIRIAARRLAEGERP